MSAKVELQRVQEAGWRSGLANVLRKENRDWWGTRRWWINIIIWLLVVNGIVAAVLWSPQPDPAAGPDAPLELLPAEVALPSGLQVLSVTAGLFVAIGVVVIMQGVVIDEKKSGTAAWILSKPVSRTAFILSKLGANAFALFIIVFVVQSVVAYLMFSARGATPPLGGFVAGMGLLALHMLFYLTLTLMLGTLFGDRAPVIAIPIGLLFGAQFLIGWTPWLVPFTPWTFIFPNGPEPGLAFQVMLGQPLGTVIPVIATTLWCLVFGSVALWRFQREEF
ncbi:MAG: ABC transporter permease [Chloroflexi bacterium]|nr:ABC transporter permease [Chloroflexota bacterium]